MDANALKYGADLALARQAAAGEVAAWHVFVLRYSGLIRGMVRRYYGGWPEDDQLNLYVAVLEFLHAKGLAGYDGRAALSTWVMTVTRSRCYDAVRHEVGRRRPPRWLQQLSTIDQEIYRLYFLEQLPLPAIATRLRGRLAPPELEALEARVHALADRLDRGTRRRLAYELHARSVGALSGRVLETMDQLKLELEDLADAGRPDTALFEARTRRLLAELEACVLRLKEPERQVIELRYYREMSAPGIARRLNLPGPRHVNSLLQRALGLLRGMLERPLEPPLPAEAAARLPDGGG